MPVMKLVQRQNPADGNPESDDSGDSWWWSPEADAVRWGVIAGIFLIFAIFFFSGYIHAQKRIKNGRAPLRYHRWMVSRSQRAQFEPQTQNQFSFYQANDAYPLPSYAAPPPAYNHETDHVPAYTPPEGASKVKADQSWVQPPSGPPPAHIESGPSHRQ